MINRLTIILKKIGIDKSIAYSSGARVVQGFTGVGSIFFISTYLTGVEQGFYFTFGSIVAIQVFFELGLTGIITQYVAHEVAHLSINNNQISGDYKYRSRLSSLLHFCVKWYTIISIVLFITLNIVGFIFFRKYSMGNEYVNWEIPWVLICIGTTIKLFQSPLNSYLIGMGYVKEMSKVSFWQQIVLPLSAWIGLACSFKLYVVGISSILAALIWNIYVHSTSLWELLKTIWKENVTERICYMKEIFPYQWRIAISWISGYFIFQLFNPVLFVTDGPTVAGQMGMTLTILNSIQALTMSWISTKIPRMSGFIAVKDYKSLDKLFDLSQKQMIGVCLSLLVAMFLGIWILHVSKFKVGSSILADRLLDYLPLLLMTIPLVLNIYVFSWATYLRCHKKEPYLLNSIVAGVLCMLSTLLLGNQYGLYGVTIGYCSIKIILFPWGYSIYKNKKAEWHKS